MALVPLPEHPAGLLMAHGEEETVVVKNWTRLDRDLRWLALVRVPQPTGCEWCTDFGRVDGVTNGMGPAKIRAVATWRDSDVCDDTERLAGYIDIENRQGFSDGCGVPAPPTAEASVV